jgi:hypothetical protein
MCDAHKSLGKRVMKYEIIVALVRRYDLKLQN